MQALRIYVDPTSPTTTLKQPLVMPKMLNLGFRGKVQTWWDLWGTWATGAFYGQRVYDIYSSMVEFAKTDPAHPPRPAPDRAAAPHAAPSQRGVSRTGSRRIPVCLLLRVHSTGPGELDRADAREQLGHHDADLEAGEARAEAVVHAVPESEVRVRVAAHVEAERLGEHELVAVRRRLPEHDLVAGRDLVAAELDARASRCGGCTRPGCVQRTISSIAVGIAPGSSRSTASWSGNSVSATIAPAIALRVVSAPAAHNKLKKNCSSWSVSCGGSSPGSVALHTTESMSSAGCARFSAMRRVPYSNIAAAACATSSVVSNASRSSLKSKLCSIHSKS